MNRNEEDEANYLFQGPPEADVQMTVVMVWPTVTLRGVQYTHSHEMFVRDGRFRKAIDAVQSMGGAWLKDDVGRDWFLPWPPAVVMVEKSA